MSGDDAPGLAIGQRLISGVLMAGMFVCVKAVSQDVPVGEIVFLRSAFAIPPLIVFLLVRGQFPQGLATRRPFGHSLRASFGAMALFASFAAIARLNVAEAILIAQLSPVLMSVGPVLLLSERVTVWRIGGLALGFMVMVWPELEPGNTDVTRLAGIAIGVLSAALSALALIIVRSLNRTESPDAIAFYLVLASMLGALLTLPWRWMLPKGGTLALLIGAGLFGGFGHIARTLAFRNAEASRLAPFEYVALLWPVLADLFIFRLPLSSSFLLAAPLVLAGTPRSRVRQRRPAVVNAPRNDARIDQPLP